MEPKAKEKFKQIIKFMKSKINNIPESDFKVRIIFHYFKKSKEINDKIKYLIKIMETMDFEEEELILNPKYDNIYSKFFDVVINNLDKKNKNKNDSKEINITINIDDLNNLNESEKTIFFWYLKFSILVENSLLLLFSFLNYEKNQTKLITTFTYLNYENIDNEEELFKSYRQQIKSDELKKIKQNKEINLIGFETLEEKFNIKTDSTKKMNNNQMTNSLKKLN